MADEDKITKVLTGFLSLDAAERTELVDRMNKVIKGEAVKGSTTDGLLKRAYESANTINFGPAPSGCPCCGK